MSGVKHNYKELKQEGKNHPKTYGKLNDRAEERESKWLTPEKPQ